MVARRELVDFIRLMGSPTKEAVAQVVAFFRGLSEDEFLSEESWLAVTGATPWYDPRHAIHDVRRAVFNAVVWLSGPDDYLMSPKYRDASPERLTEIAWAMHRYAVKERELKGRLSVARHGSEFMSARDEFAERLNEIGLSMHACKKGGPGTFGAEVLISRPRGAIEGEDLWDPAVEWYHFQLPGNPEGDIPENFVRLEWLSGQERFPNYGQYGGTVSL